MRDRRRTIVAADGIGVVAVATGDGHFLRLEAQRCAAERSVDSVRCPPAARRCLSPNVARGRIARRSTQMRCSVGRLWRSPPTATYPSGVVAAGIVVEIAVVSASGGAVDICRRSAQLSPLDCAAAVDGPNGNRVEGRGAKTARSHAHHSAASQRAGEDEAAVARVVVVAGRSPNITSSARPKRAVRRAPVAAAAVGAGRAVI